MSKHLFGMVLTHQSIYANNRGENEGNATTLQKVLRNGELYTTVSAESIRYAIREGWQSKGCKLNRKMLNHRTSEFTDKEFSDWKGHLDDDVLGFMHAKKETLSRRGLLEITRAISTTPWRGELMHNFASAGSNPAVTSKDPIPYAVEVHDTRYQFGFAITPEYMGCEGYGSRDGLSFKEKKERLSQTLHALLDLRRVGGNHARYFSDFSPEAIVLRWTDDPAPRFLYCFEQGDQDHISLRALMRRITGGDIDPSEVIIGTAIDIPELRQSSARNASFAPANTEKDQTAETAVSIEYGVKRAVSKLLERIRDEELCPTQP